MFDERVPSIFFISFTIDHPEYDYTPSRTILFMEEFYRPVIFRIYYVSPDWE